MIGIKSDGIKLEGYVGKWYVISQSWFKGRRVYLLESEQYGDDAPCIIVTGKGYVLNDEVYNGFSDLEGW